MLTPAEVAARRRRTVQALAMERSRGGGPPYVRDRRRIYYPKAEFEQWMERNRVEPVSIARQQRTRTTRRSDPSKQAVLTALHEHVSHVVRLLLLDRERTVEDLTIELELPRSSMSRALTSDPGRPRRWKHEDIFVMAIFFEVSPLVFFPEHLMDEYQSPEPEAQTGLAARVELDTHPLNRSSNIMTTLPPETENPEVPDENAEEEDTEEETQSDNEPA